MSCAPRSPSFAIATTNTGFWSVCTTGLQPKRAATFLLNSVRQRDSMTLTYSNPPVHLVRTNTAHQTHAAALVVAWHGSGMAWHGRGARNVRRLLRRRRLWHALVACACGVRSALAAAPTPRVGI